MPAAAIKGIEVISPVELKLVLVLIIGENFDIVVKNVPWHIHWVESLAPRVERRRPEVHAEGLGLVQVLDGIDIISSQVADFFAIDSEGDVVGGPLHLISVPILTWIKLVSVIVALLLLMTVTVDDIRREGVVLDGWHDFDIKLVPASSIEAGTVPVGKEGRNSALLIWRLHAGHEFTIRELLVGGERSTLEIGGGDADNRD